MAAANTVNYEDPRFKEVQADKKQALTELDKTYSGMIGQSDKYYQAQIDASKEWAGTQQQLQQDQTDFTIQKVEQQKEQAHKDYVKEQSGAYIDWQKQSDQYGANAEQQAAAGMQNTGYSETAQVGMYNAYQNRVATARESYNNAVLNYNNAIKEAQLQNNSVLAEIAYQALQTQLQLSLEGFQYKNNLILEQTNKKLEVDQMYHDRYQDVLAQINHENALAEEIRQFNMNYNEQVRQFNQEIARLKAQDAHDNAMEIKQLELQKQQLAEQKRQFNAEMAYKKAQAAKTSSEPSSRSIPKASIPKSKETSSEDVTEKTTRTNDDAFSYISAMITAGKSRNQVLSEIAIAQSRGEITKFEAQALKNKFTPRGHQYT